jgi:hypothetical protein
MSAIPNVFSGARGVSGWWAGLVILGYGLFLTLPASWSGYVIGHDTLSHLIMSRHFVDQLWAGDLYPRWLSGMNAGLGSPVFQFYGPVPYYFTALFRPMLSQDPEGWHQLGLAASLAVIASGFTAYAWLKRMVGERAALIGAVLYMSAPYHLAVDLYQRFAFAELWGFVWMPLVMLFARASMRGGKGAMAGLSLSYALLIMTHLPTTLLFSWVPVAYALWMAERGDRLGSFVRVASGMLLGIGLSAIYLLPAMATRQFVLFDVMKSGHFDFANHFLFYAPNYGDGANDFLHSLGIIVGAMMLVAAGVWLLGRKTQPENERREAGFWIIVATLAFFMMLYPSKPVWERVAIIQMVQFPWRFGIVLTFAMIALVVLWADTLRKQRLSAYPAPALILSMVILYQVIPTLKDYLLIRHWTSVPSLDHLIEEMGGANATTKALLDAAKISRYNSFLTQWSPPDLFVDTPEAVLDMIKLTKKPDKAYLVEGMGSVTMQRWQPPRIELAVKAETALQIGLLQLYYPGWVARLDGGSTRLEVRPSSPDGLLEVQVPPGTHQVRIEREALPEERAGRIVSGVSLVGLAGFVLWLRQRRSLN